MSITAEELGVRIAQARKKMRLSQAELAENLSVARATVGHWETGLVTIGAPMLVELAQVLETTPNVLLNVSTSNLNKPTIRAGGETYAMWLVFEKLAPSDQRILITQADSMASERRAK